MTLFSRHFFTDLLRPTPVLVVRPERDGSSQHGQRSGLPENCPISNRNHCPICPGIGVRFGLDSVSEMNWNRCPNCPGVRMNARQTRKEGAGA